MEEMNEEIQCPKKPSFKEQFQVLSGYSTLHGLHFVTGEHRGIGRRVIWFLLMLVGFGFLMKQLYCSTFNYRLKDHIFTTEILDAPVNGQVFPAITICNQNMMRKQDIEGKEAQVYLDELNTFKNVMIPKSFSKSKNLNSTFDVKKAVSKYGHTAKKMFKKCSWDGEFCSYRNFTTVYSHMVRKWALFCSS